MGNELLIGVDVGTQSMKASLYTARGEYLRTSRTTCALQYPSPDAVTQDPDELVASVLRCIRKLTENIDGEVAALSVSAQMAGILGIGRDGRAITLYDSWLDVRCMPYARQMDERLGNALPRITGGQPTCAHGPKMLWWKHERPEVYCKISRFVTLSAYISMRLCGLDALGAYIDDTHLHFTGFADNQHRKWHSGLLSAMDIDGDKLPPIVRPNTIVGALNTEMAAACGLKAGTPVAAGCGDSAASAYGAGVTSPGLIYDVAGTASIFSCSTDQFAPDTQHKTVMTTRSVVDGLYNGLAYISGGGMCLKWYADQCGADLRGLDGEAANVPPGSEGLYFIPHFTGRTCPGVPSVRGGWLGLGLRHTRAHMYRAIMESIVYEYRLYLNIMRQSDARLAPTEVLGAGGGAGSRLFAGIKADVLELPYRALRNCDTATYAGAMIAGCACGLLPSLETAVGTPDAEHTARPNAENRPVYRAAAERYAKLLDKMEEIYK